MMDVFMNSVDVLGDDVVTDSIIDRSIKEFSDDVITTIGDRAFAQCQALTSVNCPAVENAGRFAFSYCTALTSVNLPMLTNMGGIEGHVFEQCSALTSVNLPMVTTILPNTFNTCRVLQKVDLSSVSIIDQFAFYSCFALTSLILRNTNVVNLKQTNAFQNMSMANGACYIYVPSVLVDAYKAATNWSTYASQIRAIEDYPEICGG